MSYADHYSNTDREILCSAVFFIMGCLWFLMPVLDGMKKINASLMGLIAVVYIFQYYKRSSDKIIISKGLCIVIALTVIWIIHTCLTGLWEFSLSRNIPIIYRINARGNLSHRVRHMIYGESTAAIIYSIIKTVVYIFLYYVVIAVLKEDRKRKLIRWFARGTLFMMPFILVFMFSNNRFLNVSRLGPAIPGGGHVQPNTVGLVFMFTFYVNLVSLFAEKRKFLKAGHLIFCIISLTFVIMSGTRSCMLSIVTGMGYALMKLNKKYFYSLLLISAVLVSILVYKNSTDPDFANIVKISRYINRFSVERAVEDHGSGRLLVWADYYTYVEPEHLLFGVGDMSTTSVIIYDKYPLQSSNQIDHPSSTYIYILLTYGIPGLMCLMIFIFKMLEDLFTQARANEKGRIEIINIGIAISNCVWGLASYDVMIGGTVSMFHLYAISQALMKPIHDKRTAKKLPPAVKTEG